jgi:hypothetical protein
MEWLNASNSSSWPATALPLPGMHLPFVARSFLVHAHALPPPHMQPSPVEAQARGTTHNVHPQNGKVLLRNQVAIAGGRLAIATCSLEGLAFLTWRALVRMWPAHGRLPFSCSPLRTGSARAEWLLPLNNAQLVCTAAHPQGLSCRWHPSLWSQAGHARNSGLVPGNRLSMITMMMGSTDASLRQQALLVLLQGWSGGCTGCPYQPCAVCMLDPQDTSLPSHPFPKTCHCCVCPQAVAASLRERYATGTCTGCWRACHTKQLLLACA